MSDKRVFEQSLKEMDKEQRLRMLVVIVKMIAQANKELPPPPPDVKGKRKPRRRLNWRTLLKKWKATCS